MRFVSAYARLGLGTAQTEKFQITNDNELFQVRDSLSVQFGPDGLTQHDIDTAMAAFPSKWRTGQMLEGDGVTPESPMHRIGLFDTEAQGWDDETREKVEKWMLAKPNFGSDFVQVKTAEQLIEKPWPSYNSTHHFKIASLAAELGLVEEALAYERANKNRQGVIDALEEQAQIRPKAAPSEEAGEVVAA